MSQATLNFATLFPASLRDWQARWKAQRGSDNETPASGAETRQLRLSRPRRTVRTRKSRMGAED